MTKRCLAVFAPAALVATFAASPSLAAPAPPLGADDEQLALGSRIPGFGGAFVDAGGALHVYVLDPAAGGAAVDKALGAPANLHRGDFTFERLLAWKRALGPLLGVPGVLTLDADEARNRVTVGIARGIAAEDRERLDAVLAERGVPSGAVVFREGEPFAPLPLRVEATRIDAPAVAAARPPASASLQDKVRPVPGGMQVAFGCSGSSCFVCTTGFTAYRGKTLGFVTNSHCTGERGTVDFTRYSQSSPSGGIVGTEIVDPALSACDGERRCRFSDAAFVKFDKKTFGSFARIARPHDNDPVIGSVTMTPGNARLVVGGAGPSPLQGDVVHKVGRTTGWTYGQVVGTCVQVNVGEADLTYSCQTVVAAGAGSGDSGSPVFTWNGGSTALLQGLLWGGGKVGEQDVYVFSPLPSIQQELGSLRFR